MLSLDTFGHEICSCGWEWTAMTASAEVGKPLPVVPRYSIA
jgi:hypothetical protein